MYKHYKVAFWIGATLSAISFALLAFGEYDQNVVETAIGLIVFMVYTQTPVYHKEHGEGPKEMFYSFLAFLAGLSVAYLVLWIILLIILAINPGPSLLL